MTLIGAFAALVVLLMLGAAPAPTAAQADDCAEVYPTPGPERNECFLTATALAPSAYPAPSATSGGGGGAPAPQPTATISATATLTTTATQAATSTVGPTSTATATRQPQGTPTPSATSTLVGLETVLCAPGATVTIQGSATPGTPLLAYFNERPVGGALARPDGSYTILLTVGAERPGVYPVTVRERDGRALVRELACEVPGGTPTPTREIGG